MVPHIMQQQCFDGKHFLLEYKFSSVGTSNMHDDNKFYYILLHNLNKNGAENYFYGKMVFKQQQQNVSTKSDTIDTTPETWLKNSCKIFILL